MMIYDDFLLVRYIYGSIIYHYKELRKTDKVRSPRVMMHSRALGRGPVECTVRGLVPPYDVPYSATALAL